MDGSLADFCDSPKAKEHPLFGADEQALQLLLYYDDLELCNPIGAFRKKHKVGKRVYVLHSWPIIVPFMFYLLAA